MAATAPKKPPAKPFTMVRRSIWDSRRFQSLPDDLHRYLYFYFLSCQHQTGTGCFVAKAAYVLADLKKPGGDWSEETYRTRLSRLIESGLVMADEDTGEILITGWWKDNGPSNESWFAGARKQCDAIESKTLRDVAQSALADCWEAFLSAKGLPPATVTGPLETRALAQERLAALSSRMGMRA